MNISAAEGSEFLSGWYYLDNEWYLFFSSLCVNPLGDTPIKSYKLSYFSKDIIFKQMLT